jgi:eukaryotic-like serine/threonine-protein kinase
MSRTDARGAGGIPSRTLQAGASHGTTGGSLESANVARSSFEQPVAVGRFELRERLGSGAMGIVFRAHDPELDREVAIKVLGSWHTHSPAGRDRVLREARAMARLNHPNVVAVHEVGEHDGSVFIAMELVDGTTLRGWLAETPRSWREIRNVFLAAGRGLAAAHAAGVYHRDFKPENVMISADGRVRVMDFGLACLGSPSATTDSSDEHGEVTEPFSHSGAYAGTPAYMAPEQFDGVADARCDQFSFCVALFEALFGRRPFDGATLFGLRAAVVTGELRYPSRRAKVPVWLRRTVARGLQVDPDARHPSMEALLEALTVDRVIGRRRTGVGIVALAAAVVLGALALRSEGPICDGAARAMAETWSEVRAAELVDAFVASGLPYAARSAELAVERMDETTNRWIEVHTQVCERGLRREQASELLDRRMSCLDEQRRKIETTLMVLEDADLPIVKRATDVLAGLPVAEDCLRDADAMPLDPPARVADDVRAVRTLVAEADALARAGKWARAEAIAEEAVEQARHIQWPPLVAEALFTLGVELIRREEYPRALEPLADAFFVASGVRRYEIAAESAEKLVRAHGQLGRWDEAMVWSRHAELALEKSGAESVPRARLEDAIASALTVAGRFDEAAARHLNAIDLAERGHPRNELLLSQILSNSAQALSRGGNHEEAARRLERALEILEAAVGPEHPRTLVTLNNMGIVSKHLGRLDEALQMHERALEIWERDWGPDDVETLTCRESLGQTLVALGRHEEALEILVEVLERTRARGDDPRLWLRANNVGHALSELGRKEEALQVFEEALAVSKAVVGHDHVNNATLHHNIGSVLLDLRRHEAAIEHLERSVASRRAHVGPAHDSVARSLLLLGTAKSAIGQHPQAVDLLREALAIRERGSDTPAEALAYVLAVLGEAERASGDPMTARKTFERAVALVDAHDLRGETARRVRLGLEASREP